MVQNLKIELVRIMISEGITDGVNPDDAPQYVMVAAKQTESGIQYYIADMPVAIDEMKGALIQKQRNGVSVIITQFDRRLPHSAYIAILDIAKQCGITDVFDLYTKKEEIS